MISGSWSPTRLLGRDAELQTLTACLDRARAGSVAVAVLEGPAGIGKTRLVDELAARAEGDGFRCLRAACEEALGRPFGPLLDALAAAEELAEELAPGSGAAAVPGHEPSSTGWWRSSATAWSGCRPPPRCCCRWTIFTGPIPPR